MRLFIIFSGTGNNPDYIMIYTILLIIHIAAGGAALLGAAGAVTTKVFNSKHKWHVLSGRIFFTGMVLIFLTSLPMTILRPNLFLFLIGIFSFYLAFNGWRRAVNRSGIAGTVDFIAVLVMGVTGAIMLFWGGWLSFAGNGNGFTLMVFGGIGSFLSIQDIRGFRKGPIKGKVRIRAHVASMMAATIAATTAFLVVNIETDPVWIAWLLPTVILTPAIIWMRRKLVPKRA